MGRHLAPAETVAHLPGTSPACPRHARAVIAGWVTDYNTARPHSAIGYQTPAAYAAALNTHRQPALVAMEGSAPMAVAHAAHMRNTQLGIPVASG